MRRILVILCASWGIMQEATASYGRYQSCPSLTLKNGKLRYRHRGRFVKFLCNTGYILAGDRFSTCAHGEWEYPPPKCVRTTCKVVKPQNNVLIYPSHNGGVLHFFCKPEYKLVGANTTYCDGHVWDANFPTCLKSNEKPKLSCDFEDENICGWTHDVNHDFDWQRMNFKTPSGSIGTGPSYDHTKGAGKDGYYMYIESSSRNENDTARLISPIYEATPNETCLEFFYHMYGATTGYLNVYLKLLAENWDLKNSTILFSKFGNQGNHWYKSLHKLGVIKEDYQIVFEGVRGSGYVSDMAIDDVRIIENCDYGQLISASLGNTTTTTEADFTTLLDLYDLPEATCLGRCGDTNNTICSCDDFCYTNSTCCPDFIDLCILVSQTTESYTTETSKEEIPSSTSTTTTVPTSTAATTTVATKGIKLITSAGTTTELVKETMAPTRKVKLVFLQPTPTPEVIRVTPPTTTKSDKDLYFTTVDKDEEIRKEAEEILEEHLKVQFSGKFNQKRVLENKKATVKGGGVLFAVGITIGVLIILIGMGFASRKYLRRFFRRVKYGRTSHGESQSDVRFLSGEEILDFTLDGDDNY